MSSHPFLRLTRPSSTLQEIESTTKTRLLTPAPTGKLDSVKMLIRIKGKSVLRVSADQAEIKRLEADLERAVEDFGVRIVILRGPSLCAHIVHQITSSIRVELMVEDVRALSTRIMKRIEEMNHETSRAAMHGKCLRFCDFHLMYWPSRSAPCYFCLLGRSQRPSMHGGHAGAAPC
jgi:hypothetical protein